MPRVDVTERLQRGDVLLMDGGTGSELQRRGVDVLRGASAAAGLQAWSATANIEAAEVVQQVHQDYLRVGADILISNNFWTSPTRMEPIGLANEWRTYALAAADNALTARDARNLEAYVFGGIAPPTLQKLTDGRDDPDVVVMGEEAYRKEFAEHADLLAEAGVDAMLPEYVGRIADCVMAVEACSGHGVPVFLGVRHIGEDGAMQYGERLEDLVTALEGSEVAGILLMCTAPEGISAGLTILRGNYDGPIGGYAKHRVQPDGTCRPRAADTDQSEAQRGRGYTADSWLLSGQDGRVRGRVEEHRSADHRRLLRYWTGTYTGDELCSQELNAVSETEEQ